MTGDQVIELRRRWLWETEDIAWPIPAATVLASNDWAAYVQAMAAAVPDLGVDESFEAIMHPTEEDVAWAWPGGVLVVFSEPIPMEHAMTSRTVTGLTGPVVEEVAPHMETQSLAGVAVGPLTQGMTRHLEPIKEGPESSIPVRRVIWLGVEQGDVILGNWTPGLPMRAMAGHRTMGAQARFLIALVTALGHRLTRLAEPPVSAGRGERRRVAREVPGLRLLELATGASVKRSDAEPGTVEWSRRWMVRGHWRQQPCGPRNENRKLRWIDPYVKGPEDKPLDVRPTVWRTGPRPQGVS